jgi:hypothetical protein
MHIFCYNCLHKWLGERKKTCPLCRTRDKEQLIRDHTFEEELQLTIIGGMVSKVDAERVTEDAYGWTDVVFGSGARGLVV